MEKKDRYVKKSEPMGIVILQRHKEGILRCPASSEHQQGQQSALLLDVHCAGLYLCLFFLEMRFELGNLMPFLGIDG